MDSFRKYNRVVKRFLVNKHKWDSDRANKWIHSHTKYMQAMWEDSNSEEVTAHYIANTKED
jgi:hypothetical protein